MSKVILGDWLNNNIPDKSIDVIMADPPYFEVKGEFDFKAKRNKLKENPHHYANFKRTNTEFAYLIGLMILTAYLAEAGDGDEEKSWAFNMLALQSNRLFTEMAAYTAPFAPVEGLRLMESPTAQISTIKPITNLLYESIDWKALYKDDRSFFVEYKSGDRKGDAKALKYLGDALPLVKNIRNWGNPEDILPFYENK